MKIYSFVNNVSGLVLSCVLLAGCAVNPVTGQQQLMLLSEQDEVRMGLESDRSIIEQYGLYDDSGLQEYLQDMGLSMSRISHRPNLNWQFKVMDSPVVNAFAAPGGYIYVTRGLLAATNNEAELAGVIGHEIGHVTARHSARQYSKMMLANLGLSLGQSVMGGYGDMLGRAVEVGAGFLFLKFSRDDEREADALGVEYAARVGYDASRIADFFITLQRQTGADGQQAARLPEFFSTHPNPANRESNVRAMANSWRGMLPGMPLRVERDALLRQLDGLVYGDDPRQGFRDGDWYYLPQYGVKVPIQSDWSFAREGSNLQMSHPQGKAATLVSIVADKNADRLAAAFVQSSGAKVHQNENYRRDGMAVRKLVSVIQDGKQSAVVSSHFFQRDQDVFVFHGMTGTADFKSLSALLDAPANGFAVMTDRGRLNPRPQRIAVKSVVQTASMEQTLHKMKVTRELWDKVAWLNGRSLADTVFAGEKIKVIE